ncbi:MAG TPA: ComEC/Rec2 family competence protein [Elusimicrobiales bacterium]|nr:ComEC/Rec2 family competence protein [Elusimicrobiales bacterium]
MLFSYYRRPLFLLLLFYAANILIFRGYFLKPPPPLPFPLPRYGALVEGRLSEYPAFSRGRWRCALDTGSVYGTPLRTGLMVYARELGGASYGDRVEFLADLSAPAGSAAPGGFDWADFLSSRGIAAEARTGALEVVKPASRVLLLARAFRARVLDTFERNLEPEAAAVMGGVVIGEKKNISPEMKVAFQDSGAMHLLVASGSNVGFVVVVLYALCSRLGLRRKYSGLAALLCSGFYVLSSGLDPPLVRAYLMFSFGLGAFLLRREVGAFHSLTVAALALLAVAPRYLFDVSFQMSFLAAYGLTVGMAVWDRRLNDIFKGWVRAFAAACGLKAPDRLEGLAVRLGGLFMISFFAQLFLYPLLALYFHRISAVSLVSNVVLVPASGIAMGLGFLMAVFSGAGFVFKLFAWPCAVFTGMFISAVKFFAALPFSAFSVGEPSPWGIAGFYILAFAVLHAPLFGFKNIRLYACAALGLCVMAAGSLAPAQARGLRLCRAELFGDSNTNCALLRLPEGGIFLVNPGVGGKKLADAVFAAGATRLEGIALTSLEEKNFNGLAELSRLVGIGRVMIPYGPAPEALRGVLAGLKKKGAAIERIWPGETSAAGVKITSRWPAAPGYTGRADLYDWEIGPVKIENGAGSATRLCAGPKCPATVRVQSQKGKTAVLEFELP